MEAKFYQPSVNGDIGAPFCLSLATAVNVFWPESKPPTPPYMEHGA